LWIDREIINHLLVVYLVGRNNRQWREYHSSSYCFNLSEFFLLNFQSISQLLDDILFFGVLSDSSNRGVYCCSTLSSKNGRKEGRKEGSIAHYSVALSEPFLSQVELERFLSRRYKQH
jgi:hypothetical protein